MIGPYQDDSSWPIGNHPAYTRMKCPEKKPRRFNHDLMDGSLGPHFTKPRGTFPFRHPCISDVKAGVGGVVFGNPIHMPLVEGGKSIPNRFKIDHYFDHVLRHHFDFVSALD